MANGQHVKTRRRRIIVGIIILMLALVGLSQCVWAPPVYWGESIHGRVIDADTGEPIDGAVVMADWKLYGGGIGHGGHRQSLLVQDTVTDRNGDFTLPEWGPEWRPAYTILDKAPWLIVFKAGYDHRALWNERASNTVKRASDWNRKTIELTRGSDSAERRVTILDLVLSLSELQRRMLEEILKESVFTLARRRVRTISTYSIDSSRGHS
jgi:hypothetical protein